MFFRAFSQYFENFLDFENFLRFREIFEILRNFLDCQPASQPATAGVGGPYEDRTFSRAPPLGIYFIKGQSKAPTKIGFPGDFRGAALTQNPQP